MNALYKVESGASKRRRREKEQEYWNSMNGPITTNLIPISERKSEKVGGRENICEE